MAFDSKYFTGTDSSSYFTENSNLYKSSQGLTIGDESGMGNSPLSSTTKAIQHGFQTLMILMNQPGAGRGAEGIGNVDRISQQQLDATAEMLRLNKMNFITHGPIIDLLGFGGEENKESVISAEKRDENARIFEKVIENTDKMAQKADLKNTPLTIHASNAIGPQGDFFDSGYKTKDGKVIYGQTGSMIKKDTGQLVPMQSSFKWLPITDSYKNSYELKEGTEENGYALFEITPKKHFEMANATALDEVDKKISDIDIKLQQLREIHQENSPGFHNLGVERRTLESDRFHLTSGKIGGMEGENVFVTATDYMNEMMPNQITRLAMASYKTKSQPVLAIENMPMHQFGKPEEVIKIVEESRKKFAKELEDKEGLDYDQARETANKLIGSTMDIGHLNTLKAKINPDTNKYWTDEDLKKEAEKMAKAGIKLVHIADNIGEFGKDSHLMLGRGNAKIDEMLDILKENGFKGQAAIESYEGEGEFDKVWARNNIRVLGSMYESGRGPSIMDVDLSAPYSSRSSNYGHKVSDLHWSQWGGPFAGMHTTFGGGGGDKRDGFSGTPTN